jgi:lipopolysaccharide transport system ATP-binding protein
MGDVSSKEGRTVLFVSHNMIAIDQLCTRGIVLKNGRIFFKGSSRDAINKYTQKAKQTTEIKLKERNDRKGSQWLKFNEVTFHDETGNKIRTLMSGQNVSIRIHYKSKKQRQGVKTLIAFSIKNEKGYLLSNLNSIDTGNTIQNIYKEGYFECHWDNFNLRSGNYFCTLFCSIEDEIVDWISNAFTIQVDDGNFYETGKLIDRNQGDILIKHYWTSKKE